MILRLHAGLLMTPLLALHNAVSFTRFSTLLRNTKSFLSPSQCFHGAAENSKMAQAGDTETPRIETRAAGFLVYRQQSQDPEFLMMKASYEPFHWTPPKGHVDGTESALQTALRETREEAGISEGDLEIDRNFERRLHYVARGKNKETVYFLARVRNACKPVVLSDEHTEARWLSAEAAAAIGGFEDMARVLMEADAHIRTSRATQA